jgi:hypothetical protein
MAKLTKVQRQQILAALNAIRTVNSCIASKGVAFCHITTTNREVPQHRSFRNGEVVETRNYENGDQKWSIDFVTELTIMEKDFGSALVSRFTAEKILTDLLAEA